MAVKSLKRPELSAMKADPFRHGRFFHEWISVCAPGGGFGNVRKRKQVRMLGVPGKYARCSPKNRKNAGTGRSIVGKLTDTNCLLPPRKRPEGGLNAGDKASNAAQSAVSVPSLAHSVFSSWCADIVRIAGLVSRRSGEIEHRVSRARVMDRLVVSPQGNGAPTLHKRC